MTSANLARPQIHYGHPQHILYDRLGLHHFRRRPIRRSGCRQGLRRRPNRRSRKLQSVKISDQKRRDHCGSGSEESKDECDDAHSTHIPQPLKGTKPLSHGHREAWRGIDWHPRNVPGLRVSLMLAIGLRVV